MPKQVILEIIRDGVREEIRANVVSMESGGEPLINFEFVGPHTFNEGDTIEIIGYTYDANKLAAEFKEKRNERS